MYYCFVGRYLKEKLGGKGTVAEMADGWAVLGDIRCLQAGDLDVREGFI